MTLTCETCLCSSEEDNKVIIVNSEYICEECMEEAANGVGRA